MRIFIGIKYYPDGRNKNVIEEVKKVIEHFGHEPYVFAEEGYVDDEVDLMQKALREIEKCDVVLVDASEASFGIGIEAGYAFAKNKNVLTITHDSKEGSRTLKGISRFYCVYKDTKDLKEKLKSYLKIQL